MTDYYAQFDGEDVAGKRYALGEKIDDDTHPQVLRVLRDQGRIAETPPTTFPVPLSGSDKDVGDMTRSELEAAALAAFHSQVRDMSDDALREGVTRHRERVEAGSETDDSDDSGSADTTLPDERALSRMKTDELVAQAQREEVSLDGADTNPAKVQAILAARNPA
jgi:hypothetical protein